MTVILLQNSKKHKPDNVIEGKSAESSQAVATKGLFCK
jgi:hypothetical protein